MWVFNIILAQSASLSISNIAKPVQIFYVIFRIMENWRIDMILLCLKWFCFIENIIEWLNSRKAYKKQTLILLEKYLERKSERPGKIFPIQMEREKLDIFHLPRKEESWKVFPKILERIMPWSKACKHWQICVIISLSKSNESLKIEPRIFCSLFS